MNKPLFGSEKNIKKFLQPFYYSYAGCKLFNMFERLTGYKIEKRHFYKKLGYYPDLKNPQSFYEKIVWKKINDRNPLLQVVSDKYAVRGFIKEVLGEKEAGKILVPLLFVTDNPGEIPFDILQEEYIIKPNHASGVGVIAENIEKQKRYTVINKGELTIAFTDSRESRNEIIKMCKGWLSIPFGFYTNEWAYQKIKRKIVIEKLLRDNSGKIPPDYRFFIFHGKCHFIFVDYDKFIDFSRAFYTPDWRYINVRLRVKQAGFKKKPENLKSMIEIAESLGKPFDSIRVDLYLADDKIYFGELTSYHTSARVPFNPLSFDFELGSKWKLVPDYWRK